MRDYGGFDNGMRCEPSFLFESVARVKNIPRGALTSTFSLIFFLIRAANLAEKRGIFVV